MDRHERVDEPREHPSDREKLISFLSNPLKLIFNSLTYSSNVTIAQICYAWLPRLI